MATQLDNGSETSAPIRVVTKDTGAKSPVSQAPQLQAPQLQIDYDELLLSCWREGCAFAKGFRSDSIEIDHVLLGATYVKAAAEVLRTATDDVEGLRHDLAARCARSSGQESVDPDAYIPSEGLRRLLFEAAALAAGEAHRKIGLHHLISALRNSKPPNAIISILPRFRIEIERRDKELIALTHLPDLIRAAVTDRLLPALENRVETRLDEIEGELHRKNASVVPERPPSLFSRVRARG